MVLKTDAPRRERILALDLLRGYFLIVILIDHLGFFPSALELLSGRGQLWASAAEGFFIISGILVGYVYTPRILKGFTGAFIKLWKRAGQLYISSVLLTWLFVYWGNFHIGANIKPGLWTDPPLGEFLQKTLLLQYGYGWADFLLNYVVFMLLAPFVLWLCTKRLGWLVMAISFVAWLFRGESFMQSWQMLFIGGIVAGYYLPRIEGWFRVLPEAKRYLAGKLLISFTLVTLLASMLVVRISSFFVLTFNGFSELPYFMQTVLLHLNSFQRASEPWVAKWTLEPGRVVIAVLWFTTFYLVFRAYEQQIDKYTRGVLRTFGQRSLFVYGAHSIMVFGVLLIFWKPRNFIINTGLTFICLAVLYTLTRIKIDVQTVRRIVPGLQKK